MPSATIDFLDSIASPYSCDGCGLDRLAVHNRSTGFGFASFLFSHSFPQRCIQLFPHSIFAPVLEVTIDRLPSRKVVGQQSPRTAAAKHVEYGIHHFPYVHATMASSSLFWRNERSHQQPFNIAEITVVQFAGHRQSCSFQGYLVY